MNYQLNDGVSSVFKVVEALLLKLSLTFGKSLFLPWGRKIVINSLCVGQFNELQGGNVSLVFPHLCNNMKMFNIKIMQRGNYQVLLTLGSSAVWSQRGVEPRALKLLNGNGKSQMKQNLSEAICFGQQPHRHRVQ